MSLLKMTFDIKVLFIFFPPYTKDLIICFANGLLDYKCMRAEL